MKNIHLPGFWAALIAAFFLASEVAFAGEIRDDVEDRRYLRCGYEKKILPFSKKDHLADFAQELCQAFALALFRDKDALKSVTIPAGEGEAYLQGQRVDLLMLSPSQKEKPAQLMAAPLIGNRLTVMSLFGQKTAGALAGKRICTLSRPEYRSGLAVFSQKQQISFSVVAYKTAAELQDSILKLGCTAVALPAVELADLRKAIRRTFPRPHVWETILSGGSLGIVVDTEDREWLNIARSFGYVLLQAEVLGLTADNVDNTAAVTRNSVLLTMLGMEGDLGSSLGLDRQWAYRVIQSHGNYGEIYNRYLGDGKGLVLDKKSEELLNDESLLTAPRL
ncbi:hypothetical protein O4H49_17865 [Kiloniella laminariae]|uniref:Solute-binding protein family 3/N-terminal domain-containing protein n=1 Tax=Kiloniella laminariae TaxID=454162 RepID=A0ABT4LNG6_9PROT|nr:hypothetical protein [Kiloniella laminariae]MCZ4282656.1 hypothetical protein [Kiloniella laminariae]